MAKTKLKPCPLLRPMGKDVYKKLKWLDRYNKWRQGNGKCVLWFTAWNRRAKEASDNE